MCPHPQIVSTPNYVLQVGYFCCINDPNSLPFPISMPFVNLQCPPTLMLGWRSVLMWPRRCWRTWCKGFKKHLNVFTMALTPLLLLEHSGAKTEGDTQREGLSCHHCWDYLRSDTTCKSPNMCTSSTKPRRTNKPLYRQCVSFGATGFRWFVTDTIACKVSYHAQSHPIAINPLDHKGRESTDLVCFLSVSLMFRIVVDT